MGWNKICVRTVLEVAIREAFAFVWVPAHGSAQRLSVGAEVHTFGQRVCMRRIRHAIGDVVPTTQVDATMYVECQPTGGCDGRVIGVGACRGWML